MRIGRTGGSAIRISVDGKSVIDCSIAEAETRWASSLADWLDGRWEWVDQEPESGLTAWVVVAVAPALLR
jgi:hypothetical protein